MSLIRCNLKCRYNKDDYCALDRIVGINRKQGICLHQTVSEPSESSISNDNGRNSFTDIPHADDLNVIG